MSIFDSIKNAIFGHAQSASGNAAAPTAGGTSPVATRPTAGATPAIATPHASVDVEPILDGLNARNAQKLNWRTSIVDLMKLVGIDASLEHRKALAKELGYSGDTNDSAAMNIWLHKQVMKELEENGGKVPNSLVA